MGKPAAKAQDKVTGVDTHIVLVPQPSGPPSPTPLPHPFSGSLDQKLSTDVQVEGKAAAIVGSVATNQPAHTPTPPGTSFQAPPANRGTVTVGSSTVLINGKGAARAGDTVDTCDDVGVTGESTIIASSTVWVG